MSQLVFTTVKFQKSSKDLALPGDIPVGILATSLAQVFDIEQASSQLWGLMLIQDRETKSISNESTLLSAGIMCGDILELRTKGTTGPLSTKSKEHSSGLSSRLHAYFRPEFGSDLPLGERVTSIGRTAPNQQRVDLDLGNQTGGQQVSRRHAHLEVRDDQYFLIDDGSMNGTDVNGEKLAPHQPRLIKDGDTIHIGGDKGVKLVFHINP